MSEQTDIPSIKELARFAEHLDVKCFCGTPLLATDVDYYVAHSAGILVKETIPEKAWIYLRCSNCGHDWALWKILKRASTT